MKIYQVKEIFYTLQGEGAQTGRPAVFCRFAGCNLWSGREEDRQKAICDFCDTDFLGTDGPRGGQYDGADALAQAVASHWPGTTGNPYVVLTGGEPLLQLDKAAVAALHSQGFEIAVETNGTRLPPAGLDWITVSPKVGAEFVLKKGNELKIIFPQANLNPADYENLEFDHFFIQPMDTPNLKENTRLALQYCLEHPQWRLSLQMHKIVGIR